ncbi:hypothetical protein ACFCXF_27010 [Streptomyces virginiae]|uniref:hypothetical protein n=1 Tax=Streptomyces virginiae TaxID=1961 RepID=UPI0005278B8F|nr:hypothetical protein [Streptomyces virginiae]
MAMVRSVGSSARMRAASRAFSGSMCPGREVVKCQAVAQRGVEQQDSAMTGAAAPHRCQVAVRGLGIGAESGYGGLVEAHAFVQRLDPFAQSDWICLASTSLVREQTAGLLRNAAP